MGSKAPTIEDAVAIIPVRDVQASVDFYVDTLGFESRFVSEDKIFATIVHGDAAVHFHRTDVEDALHATANHIMVYVWVNGLDALYARYEPKLKALEEGSVRAPFDQPYGMREFHVKDPDGCLLLFGENIER